ncbi:uncharacterized protein G2W53_001222 [Senna tora]|uniref:Uncharacterized protein n=1 Tax=Senna tora TaxID=362788 RepID=A0A834XFT3_9FABA|nr:uncharacterized protein G2W53_001222 [Senna tora]
MGSSISGKSPPLPTTHLRSFYIL